MSVIINIQGTPIEFPSSGESPNWAPAVIEFAQATAQALLSATGPYDISQRVVSLTNNINTDLDIEFLNFPIAAVRAGYIKYSIIRNYESSSLVEAGNIICVYDSSRPTNQRWTLSRDYVGNDTGSTFKMTDDGQVQITTTSLTGYTSGKISFSAQALQQNL
jgi:hypothetical protein